MSLYKQLEKAKAKNSLLLLESKKFKGTGNSAAKSALMDKLIESADRIHALQLEIEAIE